MSNTQESSTQEEQTNEPKPDAVVKADDNNGTIQKLQPLTRDIIRDHNELIEFVVREEMIEGIHYGIIPGTKNRTLLKPGGDLLKRTFNLLDHYEIQLIDEGDMHRTYEITCKLQSLVTEKVYAVGYGTCSTLESKYRYKWIYKNGRKDYREEIPIEQRPDLWNTVKKMAKKRAMLDAVNSFFSPAGFFPSAETDKRYKNRIVFEWNPTRSDLENPDWFIEQISQMKFKAELEQFMDEFSMDIDMLGKDSKRIKEFANKKWSDLK